MISFRIENNYMDRICLRYVWYKQNESFYLSNRRDGKMIAMMHLSPQDKWGEYQLSGQRVTLYYLQYQTYTFKEIYKNDCI